jgi:hypothetical protein
MPGYNLLLAPSALSLLAGMLGLAVSVLYLNSGGKDEVNAGRVGLAASAVLLALGGLLLLAAFALTYPSDRRRLWRAFFRWTIVAAIMVIPTALLFGPTGGFHHHTDDKSKAVAAITACRGKELQALEPDQARELLGHMAKLGLERYPDRVDRFGPWYVWDFGKKDQPPLYLLFEAGKKMKLRDGNKVVAWVHLHPSATPVSLTLLDGSGKVVSETDLTTGWRCYLKGAKLQPAGDKHYPLVVLETELGSGPGPDIKRQHYAWLGQRFDLVRLENGAGKATRNRYYVNHFRSGCKVAELAEAEWEAELMSPERARVLRALVWLGGFHWDLHAEEWENKQQFEDVDQVKLWRKVRAREKVIARVRELVKDEDVWLREAAELAADPQEGHF